MILLVEPCCDSQVENNGGMFAMKEDLTEINEGGYAMREFQFQRPPDWGEARRLRALELKSAGWKQRDIARELGLTPGAISQWVKKARLLGIESLLHRPPGRSSRLSEEQKEALTSMLEKGAAYHGFEDGCWTRARVNELLLREFGVSYHPTHVGRLMRSYGIPLHRGRLPRPERQGPNGKRSSPMTVGE